MMKPFVVASPFGVQVTFDSGRLRIENHSTRYELQLEPWQATDFASALLQYATQARAKEVVGDE